MSQEIRKKNYNTALYLDFIFGDLSLKNNIVMAYNFCNEFCFRQLPCLAKSVIKPVTTTVCFHFQLQALLSKTDSAIEKKANRNKTFQQILSSIL